MPRKRHGTVGRGSLECLLAMLASSEGVCADEVREVMYFLVTSDQFFFQVDGAGVHDDAGRSPLACAL